MKVALVTDKKRIDLSVQLKKTPRSQAYNSFLCLVDELCEQWSNTDNVTTQECSIKELTERVLPMFQSDNEDFSRQ